MLRYILETWHALILKGENVSDYERYYKLRMRVNDLENILASLILILKEKGIILNLLDEDTDE